MFKKQRPQDKTEKIFDSKVLEVARVTRVTGGGKKMSFRAILVLGDKKGRVALAVAKGKDVAQAVDKATRLAKRAMITVPIVDGTIPHQVEAKYGPAKILLKPQTKGKGLVAGGSARTIFKLCGIRNITAKMIGVTKNNLNNAMVAIEALKKLKVKNTTAQVVENKENN